MNRESNSVERKKRREKLLRLGKGYFGSKSRTKLQAKEQWMKSSKYSYNDRKKRVGVFRSLWITRISAFLKNPELSGVKGLNYSRFIYKLRHSSLGPVIVNRKQLSEMAINNPSTFRLLISEVENNSL